MLILLQVKELDTEIAAIQNEQEKLENAEKRLSIKVEEFKSKKEIIKADNLQPRLKLE